MLSRYCPDGLRPMAIPHGDHIWELMDKNGDTVADDHWAPVGGRAPDTWIQVGWHVESTCKTYQQLSPLGPSWGASGHGSFEATGYLMCCLEPASVPAAVAEKGETPTTPPRPPPAVLDGVTDVIVHAFDPVLYDRSHGWKGRTHDEAARFCADKGALEESRVLCPIEV